MIRITTIQTNFIYCLSIITESYLFFCLSHTSHCPIRHANLILATIWHIIWTIIIIIYFYFFMYEIPHPFWLSRPPSPKITPPSPPENFHKFQKLTKFKWDIKITQEPYNLVWILGWGLPMLKKTYLHLRWK